MAQNSNSDVGKLPFERAIEELESIVKRLEEGKVPLEESVAIYERGEALKRRCEDLLRQAEARVEKITLGADGKPTGTEPLERGVIPFLSPCGESLGAAWCAATFIRTQSRRSGRT